MIVVDTNVASELMKPSPSAAVTGWVRARPGSELYTTSITLAEILYGIHRLPDGHRKELLHSTASDVFAAFEDHVLPFDSSAAVHYAEVVGGRDQLGLPIDGFDAQIACICRAHGAALATRNLKDFQHTDVNLIDPWQHPLSLVAVLGRRRPCQAGHGSSQTSPPQDRCPTRDRDLRPVGSGSGLARVRIPSILVVRGRLTTTDVRED